MECPYCAETIKAEALVCCHCQRDLAALLPWVEKVRRLEARLAELEGPAESLAAPSLAPPRPRPSPLVGVLLLVVLPIALLLAAHGVVVLWLDLHAWVMRLVSILIPLPFGVRRPRPFATDFAMAVTVAVVAVAGMAMATGLIDNAPALPQNGEEWLEVAEYAASIGLSYITGVLLARWLFPRRRSEKPGLNLELRKLVVALVRSTRDDDETDSELAIRVQLAEERLRSLIAMAKMAAPAISALGSYVMGVGPVRPG